MLRAIVQDYVADLRAGRLQGAASTATTSGCRAATVRNDMAVLEEEGLIAAAAHQRRAGAHRRRLPPVRRPARAGQAAERRPSARAIAQFLEGAVDLDDVVDRTVRLLASLTHQVAVVQYPSLTRSTVRHVELVPIGGRRGCWSCSSPTPAGSSSGSSTSAPTCSATTARRSSRRCAPSSTRRPPGVRLTEAATRLAAVPDAVRRRPTATSCAAIVPALDDALVEEREERVVLAGTANLARVGTDFPLSHRPGARGARGARRAAQAARQLGRATPTRVAVRIGHENPYAGLQTTSVVTTGYGSGAELRRRPRRARPDPDGLPHDDGVGARRRHATSPGSSPSDRRPPPAARQPADRQRRRTSVERLLRGPRRRPRRRARRRSSRPTASWPAQLHPDVNPGPEAEEQFKKVSQAYDVLSDPEKRRSYDHGLGPLRLGAAGGFGQGFSFSDIMDAFFGGRAGAGRARPALAPAPRPGRPRPARHRPRPRPSSAPSRSSPSTPPWSARTCHGDGAAAGHRSTRTCDVCDGRGEVQQVQRSLPRPGHDHPPVRRPARASASSSPTRASSAPATAGCAPAARSRSRCPRASTPAPGSSSPARARSAPAAARPATSTSRSRSTAHATFQRRGDDLHCTVELPMTAAALGTTLDAGHLRRHARPRRASPAPSRRRRSRCAAWASPTCAAPGAATSSCTRRCRRRPGSTTSRRSCCASSPTLRGEERPEGRLAAGQPGPLRQAARRLPGK